MKKLLIGLLLLGFYTTSSAAILPDAPRQHAVISQPQGDFMDLVLALINYFQNHVALAFLLFGSLCASIATFFYWQAQDRKKIQHLLEAQLAEMKLQTEHLQAQYDNCEMLYQELINTQSTVQSQYAEELETFLYRANHDMKTPLASLIGLSNLALIEIKDHKARDYFTKISETAINMRSVYLRLVYVSEIKAAKVHLEPLNIAQHVNHVALCAERCSEKHSIHFKISMPTQAQLVSDSTLFETALLNVVENSLQFAKPDAANAYIAIEAVQHPTETVVSVRDNGIGIDSTVAPHIFNMFYRGTESSKGSGLGLYLARLAADKIGATIQFRDDITTETVFEMHLPHRTLN